MSALADAELHTIALSTICAAVVAAATGWWLLAPLGVWALNRSRADRVELTRGFRAGCSALAGALCGLGVVVVGFAPLLPAWLFCACASAVLIVSDTVAHRLPNAIVLPASVAVAFSVLGGAAVTGGWELALMAAAGGAALFGLFLVLALASPSAMGMGDVKLAAMLGMVLGLTGWMGWLLGLAAMFVIGGLVAVLALVTRGAGPRSQIPFGPSMIAATVLVAVFAWPH